MKHVNALGRLRRELGLTLVQVARRVGCHPATISRLETRGGIAVDVDAYVRGLGGRLELVARLPRRGVVVIVPGGRPMSWLPGRRRGNGARPRPRLRKARR